MPLPSSGSCEEECARMHRVVEMGRPEHASSGVLLSYDDGAASPFGLSPTPLSGASSPSPLLPAPDGKTRFGCEGRRRHAAVRLICSPFAAVFRTGCASRAGATADGGQAARRPRLEELLRMEASSSLLNLERPDEPAETMVDPYDDDDYDDSWKQMRSAIVVFDLGDDDGNKDEAPLASSEDPHGGAITCDGNEKKPAEELDGDGGGGAMLSPKALVNVERLVVVLASLGARSRALKGSYGRLAAERRVGGGAGGDGGKAEQFYDRPIPLGRRCRVQHLDESPYL